jgi:hypothetical protein
VLCDDAARAQVDHDDTGRTRAEIKAERRCACHRVTASVALDPEKIGYAQLI